MLCVLAIFLIFTVVLSGEVDSSSSPDSTAHAGGPPPAKVDIVEDTLSGHKIPDPYRWLEDGTSADTRKFVEQELAYTRQLLDPLPGREQLHQRLLKLASIGTITAPQLAGKFYFYTRRVAGQNQPVLLVREGITGTDRALVDTNQLSTDGTMALDWWFPSNDGKYVAYGLSKSGSEESVLQLIETATLKQLPETIDRTRFSSVAWKKDNSGFYYTRHPKKGEVPPGEEVYHVKVFYHTLGSDPANDPLIFGKDLDPQDYPQVNLSDDDDAWLIINVSHGWSKSTLYLQNLTAGTSPVLVTSGKEFLYSGEVLSGKVYVTTNEEAPRYRVFVVDAARPARENWKEIIPQSDAVLQSSAVIGGKLFGLYEKNASSQLKLFQLDGKFLADIPLPSIGSVASVGGRWDSNELFFDFQSFTVPPAIYRYEITGAKTSLWDKVEAPGIDPSAYEVSQVWYSSKDGTKVPMFLFHRKGLKLDGKNPTLLNGYGGFNISLTPKFVAGRFAWLERGGVFAVANLRGGSEFGEEWHRAGMLGKKQNVFDDFIAAAEFLIAGKITDREHLAIQGGSNGGLLVGAAFTQRPDLFRAVVCQVPLLDMLRYQGFQIAKLWIPEYGSATNPEQFDWLYAYSPYHHVKKGTLYPSVLFMTAESDTRVDPMHAKKMTALMQAEAANGRSPDRPILLRIETKAGHGAGKPVAKQVEEATDIYSFLLWQLGVDTSN